VLRVKIICTTNGKLASVIKIVEQVPKIRTHSHVSDLVVMNEYNVNAIIAIMATVISEIAAHSLPLILNFAHHLCPNFIS
jgi:hypothetical protein